MPLYHPTKKTPYDVLIRESDTGGKQELRLANWFFWETLYDFYKVGTVLGRNEQFFTPKNTYRHRALLKAMKTGEPIYLFTFQGKEHIWRVSVQTRYEPKQV